MSFVIAAPETLVRAASDLGEHRVDAGGAANAAALGADDRNFWQP
ncbi:PE-PGRS family protein, partial [Mycobacterium tuberculosis T92]